MNTIDYFKLQAKNLHRDFKTKTPVFDNVINDFLYEYSPKYFDIDQIVLDYKLNEEKFSLMNAQHVIADLAGFNKWNKLINASEDELELAKLLFDNQNIIDLFSWNHYILQTESLNGYEIDAETKLEIFKQVVLEDNIFNLVIDGYLLKNKSD